MPLNPIATSDRKIKLCSQFNLATSIGLELKPLVSPIVKKHEGDVRYVDSISTAEMRQIFEKNARADSGSLVEIDYVWNDSWLRDVVGPDIFFDYVIASHVMEQTADVIGWLNDILSVLRDGGILSLAVSDKRFTFNVLRQASSCSLLIDNWLRCERRPAPANVFDNFSQVVRVQTEEFTGLWNGTVDPKSLSRIFTDEVALALTRETLEQGLFRECHAYVFTPRSFLEVMRTLIATRILRVKILDFYDTANLSSEFVAVLQKTDGLEPVAELANIDNILGQLAIKDPTRTKVPVL